jgi:hypothetical protein
MRIQLLNARRVAEALGKDQVTPREKGYYLLSSMVMWTLINYFGLSQASPLWSWISAIEGMGVIGITLLGVTYTYQAAGGDENRDFVAQFTCLYVPVTITTALAVWGCYWLVYFGFRESIVALSKSHWQFAINLMRIGASGFDVLTALSVLLLQGATFYRITKLFDVVSAERSVPHSVPQKGSLRA